MVAKKPRHGAIVTITGHEVSDIEFVSEGVVRYSNADGDIRLLFLCCAKLMATRGAGHLLAAKVPHDAFNAALMQRPHVGSMIDDVEQVRPRSMLWVGGEVTHAAKGAPVLSHQIIRKARNGQPQKMGHTKVRYGEPQVPAIDIDVRAFLSSHRKCPKIIPRVATRGSPIERGRRVGYIPDTLECQVSVGETTEPTHTLTSSGCAVKSGLANYTSHVGCPYRNATPCDLQVTSHSPAYTLTPVCARTAVRPG